MERNAETEGSPYDGGCRYDVARAVSGVSERIIRGERIFFRARRSSQKNCSSTSDFPGGCVVRIDGALLCHRCLYVVYEGI